MLAFSIKIKSNIVICLILIEKPNDHCISKFYYLL